MKLVIAEKPSVARDIARVLGTKTKRDGYYENNEYLVTWCIGHLVQLADPEAYGEEYRQWTLAALPIIPEKFQKEVAVSTQKQFAIVQKLLAQSTEVICATDAGREGQLIFEYVYRFEARPAQTVKRLWISSMTDEAIQEGFRNLADNEQFANLYESARCRSEADWLVGMNFTRLFTLRYGTKLTVGRVQTPTLALLVERHKAIANFQEKPFYQLEGDFGQVKAIWHRGEVNRLDSKEEAEKLGQTLTGKLGEITKLETKRKNEERPLLFDLTELQREANRRYGYTAQETLSIAQNLYEKHKYITYPRTDSRYLTVDMKPKIPALLQKVWQVLPMPKEVKEKNLLTKPNIDKRIIQDSKVTDHHAIIVTERIHLYQPQQLTERENNVLRLIMVRFIVALAQKRVYDETKLEIAVEKDIFKASGKVVVDEGWAGLERLLLGKAQQEEEQEEEQLLSGISLGQKLVLEAVKVLEKKTSPPKPYTEATLLTAMEKAGKELEDKELKESMKGKGLGTPATRAGIIEKLISTGYVERKKKNLLPTQQGITFIELLPQSIKSVELTANWEQRLQDISDGIGSHEEFMQDIRRYVTDLVEENKNSEQVEATFRKGVLRKIVGKCPKCGRNVIESDKSFYCDGFRDEENKCNFTLWKNNAYLQARGVTLDAAKAAALLKYGRMQINNLKAKNGNTYNGIFYMEPGEKYVNFRMEFAPKTPPQPKGE
ncbi:MAG: DNA topoisomerase 3 [Peptococcaceae bacterium]|nr:DNA topoisomerase 3 [Peptococcaceae bacterium]